MLHKIKKQLKHTLWNLKTKSGHFVIYVKRKFDYYKENVDIEFKRFKTAEISVSDLIINNSIPDELLRMDIVVRYLAIEEFFDVNDYGYSLYEKMQKIRMGIKYAENALQKFKDLISSYEENGYKSDSCILVDKNLKLIDGSHRVALALYFGYPNIMANIVNSNHPVDYCIDWFYKKGFVTSETEHIINKSRELMAKVDRVFSCVIWAPAVPLADEIIHDMNYYGDVLAKKEYSYSAEEYKNIVRAVYAIDDIEKWKIDKKIEHMKQYEPQIVSIDILLDNPDFRIKGATNMLISRRGERIKAALRAKYKSRIDDYYFDNILHIADNVYQSAYMRKVFEPDIDFRQVIDLLNKYQYALVKLDSDYIPKDFPATIPVGKDIDIICSPDDMESIKRELRSFAYRQNVYTIVEHDYSDRLMIRFEISNHLIFLIDCGCAYKGIPEKFLKYAIGRRVKNKNDYYCFDPACEAIIRKVSYEANTSKQYHLTYYKTHKDEEVEKIFNDMILPSK